MLSRIGRYEVLAELGRGGFGHVYKCLDPVLGTPVAIKILMSDGDARMLVRFRNEAATSRKLTHPNIVTIYDFGDHEGQPYIVMELLEGQDLQHAIESHLPLTLLEKVQIMDQIAAGLGHAHENGILHRDVKPANVMLLRDHSIKIMDFGIALITRTNSTRMTPQGSMIGTLRYLAPEQFREDKPDPRSDIFAYGLVSYELLGGTHPFNATDPAALMYSILRDEPTPISQVVPDCPEQLQSIMERLLQKDPDQRYQTLDDVQLDLGDVLSELREQRAVTLLEEAKAASSTGELERARELTREVLALVPGHRTARLFREQLQLELRRRANRPRLDELIQQGRRAMTSGNPTEAAKKFESALALDPNDTGLQDLLRSARAERDLLRDANQALVRAEKAFKTGDYAGARMLAGQALQMAPSLERAKDLQHSAEAELMQEHRQVRLDEQIGKARQLLEARSWDEGAALLADLERDYSGETVLADLAHALAEGKQKDQREQQLAADLAAVRKQVLAGDLTGAVSRLEKLTGEYSESSDARAMLRVVRNKIESERQRDFVKAKLTEAEALESKRQFDAAVQLLDTALTRYPADTALIERRQAAIALQTARQAAIEKTLSSAAALRGQGAFDEAIAGLDASIKLEGREAALLEARESIVKEQQLADFLRRTDQLVSEQNLDAAAKLLSDPPAPLKNHAAVAKARQSIEDRLRAREKEAKQLCTRATALLASDPSAALTLLRAASPVLRARRDVADLTVAAERALEAAVALKQTQDKEADRQSRLATIKAHAAKQQFPEAEQAARDALALYPNDPALTKLYAEIQDQHLFWILEQEEQKRKDARAALKQQVNDLITAHRYADAEQAVAADLAAHRDDLEVTNLLVDVRDRRRKYESEQAAARAAQEEAKRKEARRALIAHINELIARQRFDDAERGIQSALAAQPGDAEMTALLEHTRDQRRRADEQKRKDARRTLAAQVRDLTSKHQYADAERAIEQLLKAQPGDAELQKLLKDVRAQHVKWDAEQAAIREAEAEQNRKDARDALTLRVAALLEEKRFDEAEHALAAIPEDAEIASLLAKVQQQHRDWDAEQSALRKAQEEQHRKQLRHDLTAQVGKLTKAHRYDEAERALASHADDPEIKTLLANVQAQHRQHEEQRRQQIRATLTAQVEDLLKNRHYDEAEHALAAHRDDAELATLLANVQQQHRQWDAEQAALRKAQARRELISRIRDIAARHQYNEAERAVSEALANDPDDRDLTALNFEVRGQHRQWEAEQAATRAAQEVERRKEASRVLVVRIRDLIANDRYDEADRALAQAFADDPHSPELTEVRDNLAEVRREWSANQAENEVRQTLARMRQLIAQQPAQAVAQLEALARQYAGRSEIQSMLAEARDAAARAEEEAYRRISADALRAVAPLRAKNPKRALKQLEQLPHAVQARPEVAAALDEFRRAVATAPPLWRTPAFIGSASAALLAAAAGIWFATNKPTPPAETQPVEIATDPTGVTVTAGGFTCVTPACSLRLAPGSYPVVAKRDGYEPAQQTLTIVAGTRPELLTLTLKPIIVEHTPTPGVASGTLTVRAGIADALVYIDNAPAGRTATDGTFTTKVEADVHNIRVEKVGFETPPARSVIVAKNETSHLTFTLKPEDSTLELRGAPAGVEIRISGALIGKTDGGPFSKTLPPGSKTLRFTLGTDSNEVARVFDPGRTVTLEWSSVGPAPKPVINKEPPKPVDPAEQAWEGVRNSNDPAALESYNQKFPSSPHKDEAQTRIESLIWSRTGPTDAQALKAYLSRFPSGPHAKEAATHLDDIAWNAVDKNSASALRDFTNQNPNSAHLPEARSTITQLEKKAQEDADKAKASAQSKLDAGQQQAIRTTISEFNAAFQHRNQRELRQIWANPMKDLVDAAGAGSEVTLEPSGPATINGDSGSLICTYTITVRGKANSASVRVSLRKAGDRWQMSGPFQKP
ncbi:MAG TPA: protein kinase [Bryobacteraceae bacterium]